MGYKSNEEFMFFELVDPSNDLKLARLRGREGMSELFEFEVELVSEDSDIPFEDIVGQGCVITVQGLSHTESEDSFGDEEITDRFIHGVVCHFEIADIGASFTTYRAVVVPKVWVLKHRQNCRIFQEKSVQDIVTQLLNEVGLEGDEYRWDCQGSYDPYEYCVQYRESEFNFICRLLEHEGIFYYFEHDDEKHIMVFHDDSTILSSIEGEEEVDFHPTSKGLVTNQHISKFRYAKSLTPGKVTLRDYNFEKPTLNLESEKEADEQANREVYDYPGWFSDKGRGDSLANLRLESRNTYKQKGIGKSNVNRLVPGFSFFYNDIKRDQLCDDYLLTRVEHDAKQPGAYQEDSSTQGSEYNNKFFCIPLETPYRPIIQTRIPVVEGAQTAIVTGPSGEEIYTDEHGRVKVQFHWDREGKSDQNSSCWIRVSQLWAGLGYGGFSLPRIGQEVIVDFIEGNPDKPIVTGRVHHGDNRTPYKLPDKKTVSTLKTNTSKGGGGFNELRFEDSAGEEQIFIHAEKNKDIRIKNDEFEWVGRNRHQVVVNNRYTEVKNNDHMIVRSDVNTKVEGDVNNMFDANIQQETKADENYKIGGERKVKIDGSEHLKTGMDINYEAGMNMGIKTGMKVDIKSGMTINLQAGMQINLKAGPSFISIGPAGVQISGPMVMINSGGSAGPASPSKPAEPEAPEEAVQAQVADNDEAGEIEKASMKGKPKKPDSYGPQALAMKSASVSAAATVQQCKFAKG